jgi:hypothetical protein
MQQGGRPPSDVLRVPAVPTCDDGRERLKGPVVTYKPRNLDAQLQDKRSVSWDKDDASQAEGEGAQTAAKPPPFPKRPAYEEKARQRVSKVK